MEGSTGIVGRDASSFIKLSTHPAQSWINIAMCISLHDRSYCSDLWKGDRIRSIRKAEFLSSFRCKFPTLNVILLYNSADTSTTHDDWWRLQKGALRSSPWERWKWVHARSIDQSFIRRWIFVEIYYIYPAYRYLNNYAFRVMQL